MGDQTSEATDWVVLTSSHSGRMWGVSVDCIGGDEQVTVTELVTREAEPLGGREDS